MTEPQEDPVAAKVSAAVDAWLRWLPRPPRQSVDA